MKRIASLFFIVLFISSCNGPSSQERKEALKQLKLDEAQKRSSDAVEKMLKNREDDSLRIAAAPIKVLSYKVVKVPYTSYRNIEITFKNVSNKTINAVRFGFMGKTAFDKPANVGGFEGKNYGNYDESIKSKQKQTITFSINSPDLKKIEYVRPYEIVYEDGEKYTLMVNH